MVYLASTFHIHCADLFVCLHVCCYGALVLVRAQGCNGSPLVVLVFSPVHSLAHRKEVLEYPIGSIPFIQGLVHSRRQGVALRVETGDVGS